MSKIDQTDTLGGETTAEVKGAKSVSQETSVESVSADTEKPTSPPAPAPTAKFELGMLVDHRFLLTRQLGQGGFGEVFLAKDQKNDIEVALKILQLKDMPQKQVDFYISTFQSEFSSLTKLHHPNLCNVYDFGKLPGKNLYYFTADFVSNAQDLMKSTEHSPLDEVIDLFVQLCRVVSYVHSHGLVHYDLKPANVLVQDLGQGKKVKLVDFGLATPQQSTLRATAGSLLYMSPEILLKERVANHRSDLYALGVILFQLFTRQHPFKQANSKEEIIRAHIEAAPPRVDEFRIDLEPFWQEILDRLLAKKPEERYSSATTILKTIHLNCPEAAEAPTETKEGMMGYAFSGELIAREPILDALKSQCQLILEGGALHPPAAAYLVGEHGTGKKRILSEIKYFNQLAGHPVMHFDNPHQFQTDLNRELGITDDLERTDILPDDPAQTIKEWIELFLEKTKLEPMLVLVDDLTDFSKVAQLFFEQLIQVQKIAFLANDTPRFVIMATGDKPCWPESEYVALHLLRNFTEPQVELYLKSFTGLATIPKPLTRKFFNVTSGNPFFLSEILKALVENNLLFDPSGLDLKTDIPIPSSITNAFKERFFKLGPAQQEILTTVSASPRGITEPVLEELLHTTQLKEQMEILQHQELIEQDDGWIRLKDPALAQAIQGTMALDKLQSIHRGLANSLLKKDLDNYWVAYHLGQSGDHRDAAPYAIAAAEEFRLAGDIEHEISALQAALLGLDAEDAKARVAKRRLAQIHGFEGRYTEAEQLMVELLHSTAPNPIEGARDLRTAGWLALKQKNRDQALDYFLKAKENLGDPKHSFYTALLNDIGNVYLLTRRYPEAEQTFQESFQALQKTPLLYPTDLMNNKLAVVYNLMGKDEESRHFLEEKIRLFAQNQNQITLAMTESELGYLLMRQGKYQEATPHLEQCLKLSEECHFLHNIIKTLVNLTHCYEYQSLYAPAIVYAQKQLKYASHIGTLEDVAESALSVATLYVTLGVYSKAEPLFAKALQFFNESKAKLMMGWTLLSLAGLYSETERFQECEKKISEAIKLSQELQDKNLIANLWYAQAEITLSQKNTQGCVTALKNCEPLIAELKMEELCVRVMIVKVKMGALTGQCPLASDDLKFLAELADYSPEIQIEAFLALSQLSHEMGDKEKSETHRHQAYSLYEQLRKSLPEEYQDSFRHQKRFSGLKL